jgi:hypothetical protein
MRGVRLADIAQPADETLQPFSERRIEIVAALLERLEPLGVDDF